MQISVAHGTHSCHHSQVQYPGLSFPLRIATLAEHVVLHMVSSDVHINVYVEITPEVNYCARAVQLALTNAEVGDTMDRSFDIIIITIPQQTRLASKV